MKKERKFSPILGRYIFLEMLAPFAITVAVLMFIFLMTLILDITNMIVNYQISMFDIFWMIVYSMPHFLVFIIPMAVMMSVMLGFLRFSGDNEIIALKASGVSLYGLLPSVVLFCVLGCLLTAGMTIYGTPWGQTQLKKLTVEVVSSNLDLGIRERTFNDRFKNVMLYINEIDIRNKTLVDVFIEDRRNPEIISTVVAPSGRLFSDLENRTFHMKLFNGTVSQVDINTNSAHSINFSTYDVSLNVEKALAAASQGSKDEQEMSLGELRAYLRTTQQRDDQYWISLMEYHKKFSIPFSAISLGILAVPLGLRSRTKRKSFGAGLGLLFFLFYYILLSTGLVFGEAGMYPPLIGMWVPNVVLGGLGIYMLIRTAKEKTLGFERWLAPVRQGLQHVALQLRRLKRKS